MIIVVTGTTRPGRINQRLTAPICYTGNDTGISAETTAGGESDVDSRTGEMEELSEGERTVDLEAEVERTIGQTGEIKFSSYICQWHEEGQVEFIKNQRSVCPDRLITGKIIKATCPLLMQLPAPRRRGGPEERSWLRDGRTAQPRPMEVSIGTIKYR